MGRSGHHSRRRGVRWHTRRLGAHWLAVSPRTRPGRSCGWHGRAAGGGRARATAAGGRPPGSKTCDRRPGRWPGVVGGRWLMPSTRHADHHAGHSRRRRCCSGDAAGMTARCLTRSGSQSHWHRSDGPALVMPGRAPGRLLGFPHGRFLRVQRQFPPDGQHEPVPLDAPGHWPFGGHLIHIVAFGFHGRCRCSSAHTWAAGRPFIASASSTTPLSSPSDTLTNLSVAPVSASW
jgi:hypothetical protein